MGDGLGGSVCMQCMHLAVLTGQDERCLLSEDNVCRKIVRYASDVGRG
jgi:hypothetical protein